MGERYVAVSVGLGALGAFCALGTALVSAGCQHEETVAPAAPPPVPTVASAADAGPQTTAKPSTRQVILFVWDGLRPDSVNEQDTPKLAALARAGARFPENHATYPTFTMVNATSLATGDFPKTAGFYGNALWEPDATKRTPDLSAVVNDAGAPLHYDAPVFTESYDVLRDLDAFYDKNLIAAETLFEAAKARGLTTAAIGKSGSAYLQDRHQVGYILDEKAVWPLSLIAELQSAGIPLPKSTPSAYPPGKVTIDQARNGDPTTFPPSKRLADKQSTDPTDTSGAAAALTNAYLLDAYLNYILPQKKPELSVVWFRNPDTTEHWYGPGTADARQSLRDMDALLGKLIDKLSALSLRDSTDIIVVSDHGHNSVSGRLDLFPLRGIVSGKEPGEGTVGGPDASGYSVSGDVRLADVLTRIGKFKAYDGTGCLYNPVLSGITRDGKPLYPVRTDTPDGTVCGKDPKTGKGGAKYNTPPYRMPSPLPPDSVIVAINGGSDYVYVPSHDAALVHKVVRFLQSREEIGAIFTASRYGKVPGTLSMTDVGAEFLGTRRIPDLVVSYEYDENATVAGMPGIEYESAQNYRGMHGSSSPIDIHNTLLVSGPDFRKDWADTLPTGNVDVAPTIAHVLGFELAKADGRVLEEALSGVDVPASAYTVDSPEPLVSDTVTGLRMHLPTDADGTRFDAKKTKYHVVLKTRKVSRGTQSYTYYDWARAVRE
jgi:arylsulfatase A-like enzyme